MKYAKMLALAAVAAGALMAFIGAGTASATVLCSTTVEPCPAGQKWAANTVIDFSIPSGSSASLVDTTGEELDTCSTSTVEGKLTNAGSSTETATGELSPKEGSLNNTGLTWGSCTFPTKTISATGKLEIHKIAGTSNGTLTSDSTFEVTINTIFFGSCIYGVTAGTDLGDLTEGNPAVFHANAVAEKFSGSNLACPSTSRWTATYNLTSPATTLSVGNS
jgi:hypothetical protein